VLLDIHALALSGVGTEADLHALLEGQQTESRTELGAGDARTKRLNTIANVLARSRLVEDALFDGAISGVKQYVLLGAGLDSLAYRQPAALRAVQIFEVDFPASQKFKIDRLKACGLKAPDNLTFVSLDLERATLMENLVRAGVRPDLLTVFSWLGVIYYLTAAAIDDTWRTVTQFAPGSALVFDYMLADSVLKDEDRPFMRRYTTKAREAGEPVLSFFEPGALSAALKAASFSQADNFDAARLNPLYFAGRTDGLWYPDFCSLMKAVV
jgi:methyltransferase (TIGR00027 family)